MDLRQEDVGSDRLGPGGREPRARGLMTPSALTVTPHETVGHAACLMQQAGIHHLPVTRDGLVVGVLNDTTLADALTAPVWTALRRPVAGVMHREVVHVHPDASLPEVARSLGYSPVGVVVVVEDGRLLGVVTAKDVVAAVAALSGR